MLKRGIRGHDVRAVNLSETAKKMQDLGIEYVQLVLEKSIKGFAYGQYSDEYARQIKDQLGDRKIAVLGSYINPSSPDDDTLRGEIAKFKEKIKYAKVLNPIAVGTETGKYIPEKTHTEEAYLRVRESIRQIVKEAEAKGVNVGIEGVHLFVIDTPKIMKRLVDDIGSDRLKVIFDPCNYINIDNYQKQDEMICELFDLLHDRVVCLHLKDFNVADGRIVGARVGEGLLNYPLIFKKMREYSLDLPCICENVNEELALAAFEGLDRIRDEII